MWLLWGLASCLDSDTTALDVSRHRSCADERFATRQSDHPRLATLADDVAVMGHTARARQMPGLGSVDSLSHPSMKVLQCSSL